MSGTTNIIGLSVNSSSPLSTLNGGIGRSVTPISGSVLFYDSTGVQQNNSNFFWNNSSNSFCIGTTTANAPLTIQGVGGTTGSAMLIGSFNTNGTPSAGNLIGIQINKSGVDALLMGINKNTATSEVPANAVFISNYLTNGQMSFGRGAGNGLPNSADLQIDGSGNVYVNNGNFQIGNSSSALTGISKVQTFSSNFSTGNYINIGTNGRNIGIVQGGNHFLSFGLDYNVTTPGYQYANGSTGLGATLEITTSGGFNFRTAPSGSNGTSAIVTTQVSISNTGVINVTQLAPSGLIQTDGLSNISVNNTLSSTVLGNITRVTTTKLTSGSGTYTPPTNCTHYKVRMWGGGGGGGGVAGNAASGGASGGGASGGYQESIITNPVAVSYGIGTGGAGGVAGNNSGTAGGNTTFSTFTAAGGGGGGGYTAGVGAGSVLGGGPGSNSGSPLISFIGNAGFAGITISATVAISGSGAAAPMGGGAPSSVHTTLPGLPGNSPGSGGGGAVSTNGTSTAGGNGIAGLIIIEEYYNG